MQAVFYTVILLHESHIGTIESCSNLKVGRKQEGKIKLNSFLYMLGPCKLQYCVTKPFYV